MNSFNIVFQRFWLHFQNCYFVELVSVAGSAFYRIIKTWYQKKILIKTFENKWKPFELIIAVINWWKLCCKLIIIVLTIIGYSLVFLARKEGNFWKNNYSQPERSISPCRHKSLPSFLMWVNFFFVLHFINIRIEYKVTLHGFLPINNLLKCTNCT